MDFFKKIIYWIKSLFSNKKLIADKSVITKEEFVKEEKELEIKEIVYEDHSNNNNAEKERIFDLYNQFKQNKLDISEISSDDLFMVNALLDEEMRLENNEIIKLQEENEQIMRDIKVLGYKINKYSE